MDRVVDFREDIKAYLEENKMELVEKQIDMIVDEFGQEIQSHEMENNTEVERGTTTYTKLMVKAILDVCERTKGTVFQEARYDVVEDDYSEESDAEFKL